MLPDLSEIARRRSGALSLSFVQQLVKLYLWWVLIESNYLATTLLNNAYRVTAGNREQHPFI